jgi:hypothetical protein
MHAPEGSFSRHRPAQSLIAVLICLVPVLAYLRTRTWISDDLAQPVALTTWRPFGGSHFIVAADTFWLKWAFMIVVNQLGFSRLAVAGLVAIFLLIMGLAYLAIVAWAGRRTSPFAAWASLLWLWSLPPFFVYAITDTAGRNLEITLGVLAAYGLGVAIVRSSRVGLVAMSLAIAALLVHDPFSVLYLVVSLLPVWRRGWRGFVWLAGCVLAAEGVAVGLRRVLRWSGVVIGERPFELTSAGQFGARAREISRWVQSFAGFRDGRLSGWPGRLTQVTSAIVALLVVAVLVEVVWRRCGRRLPSIGVALILVTVAAFVVYRGASGSARYLTPVFVGVALILASATNKWLRILVIVTGLISAVTPLVTWNDRPVGNAFERDLQRVIEQRNLTVGYGDYWHAQVVTYFSSTRVRALSVTCHGHEFARDVTFADDRQFERSDDRMFFIFRPTTMGTCSVEDVRTQFGVATGEVPVSDDAIVLLFDHDISGNLR